MEPGCALDIPGGANQLAQPRHDLKFGRIAVIENGVPGELGNLWGQMRLLPAPAQPRHGTNKAEAFSLADCNSNPRDRNRTDEGDQNNSHVGGRIRGDDCVIHSAAPNPTELERDREIRAYDDPCDHDPQDRVIVSLGVNPIALRRLHGLRLSICGKCHPRTKAT